MPCLRQPAPATSRTARRRGLRRGGFSLTELLVAATLGLMVMASLASLFGVFGTGVRNSQAIVNANARIRNAAWQLRQDLHGATARPSTSPTTWVRPEANAGYFQVIEGTPNPSGGLLGDVNDVLMLTTLSLGEPFSGRLPGSGFKSPVAEAVWFCLESDQTFAGQTLYNLHRRQLLVSATPGAGSYTRAVQATADRGIHDFSYRGTGMANSLADLTTPANRFWSLAPPPRSLQGDREGEDIVLTNVLAFDVKTLVPAVSSAYADSSFDTNSLGAGPPPPDTLKPLHGLQVTIRCLEPTSRQVRQITVIHSFSR